jgi:hypothetical protein
MIIGGIILLLGTRTTFYTKTLSIKKYFNKTTADSSLATQKKENLKVIAFDADDTLFIMNHFDETEKKVLRINGDYLSHQGISQQLFKVEIDNLKIYGGIKATFYL